LAVFRISQNPRAMSDPPSIELEGHVELGCFRPRELIVVKGDRDYLGVTCNGIEGVGAGVVLLDILAEENPNLKERKRYEGFKPPAWPVVGRWATDEEVWGIAGVA
jgi:hypothetical protein